MVDERAATVVDGLERDGYAVVEQVLSAEAEAAARTDLQSILADTPPGRDDFEGRRTRRVYALFAKTRALDSMATDPLVMTVLDHVLGD